MSEKKVLVNYIGRKGGGAVYAYEMTKSLINNGCKVYAIIPSSIENLAKWKELNTEELILIETYTNYINYIINTVKFRLFQLPKLKKKFKDVVPDAVYVPMIQPWTRMVNSIFGHSKKIVTVHDPKPHSGSSILFDMFCRKTAVEADDIVILSEAFRDYSIRHFKKDADHVHVVPHGIFDYYKEVENDNKSFIYDENKINFLFFGRITKYKGIHILAKAYEKMQNDNVTLTIVGSGDFSEYAKEYEGLKNVRVINRWIEDDEVGSFFRGKNIVTVLPYIDATQSGVIPIAMEYRSLVIASNTGGLSEQVKHGETGYLFCAGDENALYETMKYVAENYEAQSHILDNAYAYINTFSWDTLGRKIVDIIDVKG
ncbi:MAG: glycosyltransferase family 4 protein [Clostridia bacterium]|nr:glycosyltransferase family 4 protein [Clostridia bacterium]